LEGRKKKQLPGWKKLPVVYLKIFIIKIKKIKT